MRRDCSGLSIHSACRGPDRYPLWNRRRLAGCRPSAIRTPTASVQADAARLARRRERRENCRNHGARYAPIDGRRDRAMRSLYFPVWRWTITVRVRRLPCSPSREIPAKSLFRIEKIAPFRHPMQQFPYYREFAPLAVHESRSGPPASCRHQGKLCVAKGRPEAGGPHQPFLFRPAEQLGVIANDRNRP